jgi:DNA polymerase-3 subunit alpha
MGIYVSDHPLRGMERTLLQHATHKCEQVAELAHDTKVSMAGIISSLRSITTRKGTKMAELTLEDFTGQAKCLVFSEPYGRLRDVLEKDAVVVVNGFVMNREGQGGVDRAPEVRVKDVRPLPKSAEIMESIDPSVEATILMRVKRATRPQLQQLKSLIESAPGSCEVVVHFVDSDVEPIVLLQRVAATQDMVKKMEKLLDDAQAEVLGDLPLDRNPQPEPQAAVAG